VERADVGGAVVNCFLDQAIEVIGMLLRVAEAGVGNVADPDVGKLFDPGAKPGQKAIRRSISTVGRLSALVDLLEMQIEQSLVFFGDQVDHDDSELHTVTAGAFMARS